MRTPAFAHWTVDRVHPVEVARDADAGAYTWDVVAAIPLGPAAR